MLKIGRTSTVLHTVYTIIMNHFRAESDMKAEAMVWRLHCSGKKLVTKSTFSNGHPVDRRTTCRMRCSIDQEHHMGDPLI
jgi:hypothetical protein